MKFTALFVAAVSAQCDETDWSGMDTAYCCSEDQVDNVADATICPNGAVAGNWEDEAAEWEDDTTMVTEEEARGDD